MSCNRLKLDWTLNTSDERASFINEYTASLTFTPNEEECEMMGNYILWGRDPDGQNSEQKGFVQLERRNSTWSTTQSNVGSLDELLETPTFNESELRQPNAPVYKTPKQNFSREEALHRAPSHIHLPALLSAQQCVPPVPACNGRPLDRICSGLFCSRRNA